MQQLCTFSVDRYSFGVEVSRVQEVLRLPAMTRVPLAPPVVRGLINLRGEIVTAIDLRRRLGLPDAPPGGVPMAVILRAEPGMVSLLVDRIGDVEQVERRLFEPPPPTLGQLPGRDLIRGVYKLPDRLLLLLDADRAMAAPAARPRPPAPAAAPSPQRTGLQ
jgi:purine-binding chemotaxis protein CheW